MQNKPQSDSYDLKQTNHSFCVEKDKEYIAENILYSR